MISVAHMLLQGFCFSLYQLEIAMFQDNRWSSAFFYRCAELLITRILFPFSLIGLANLQIQNTLNVVL